MKQNLHAINRFCNFKLYFEPFIKTVVADCVDQLLKAIWDFEINYFTVFPNDLNSCSNFVRIFCAWKKCFSTPTIKVFTWIKMNLWIHAKTSLLCSMELIDVRSKKIVFIQLNFYDWKWKWICVWAKYLLNAYARIPIWRF